MAFKTKNQHSEVDYTTKVIKPRGFFQCLNEQEQEFLLFVSVIVVAIGVIIGVFITLVILKKWFFPIQKY